MAFDSTPHLLRMMLIKFGERLTPDEKNVTRLYESVLPKLGLLPIEVSGFDAVPHLMRLLVIAMGRFLHPDETDLSKLYDETAAELGVLPFANPSPVNRAGVGIAQESAAVVRLPAPHEMKTAEGDFVIPRKDCPKCGGKQTVVLTDICQSCADAEGGKYKSAWTCSIEVGGRVIENKDCGYKGKNQKTVIGVVVEEWRKQGLSEDEIMRRLPNGSKQALGIKILTDEGLR